MTICLEDAYNTATKPIRYQAPEKVGMNGNLKNLRKRRALSLTDLSRMTKLSRMTISRIENGKQKPQPRTIRVLAEALQVEVEELTSEQSRLV